MTKLRQAIKTKITLPAVLVVEKCMGTSQRVGEPERKMFYGWSVRVEVPDAAFGVRVDERFPTKREAVRAGRTALSNLIGKLSSRVNLAEYE